jgi:hypothetical protein
LFFALAFERFISYDAMRSSKFIHASIGKKFLLNGTIVINDILDDV